MPGSIEEMFRALLTLWPTLEADWAPILTQMATDPRWVLVEVVGLMFVCMAFMFAYIVVLRVRAKWTGRRRARRYREWFTLVPSYLSGALTVEETAGQVAPGDFRLFAEFLRPFLIDLTGADQERLLQLLHAMGLPGRLLPMLRSWSAWDRSFALHYLGLIGEKDALPAIRPLLQDRVERVRFNAAESLMRMEDASAVPDVLELVERHYRERQDLASWLVFSAGNELLPIFQLLVREGYTADWLSVIVLNLLGSRGFLDATWDILDLSVRTGDREVRLACYRALAGFEESTLVGLFEEGMEGEDPRVASVCARALGRIGNATHIPDLLGLLSHQDFWVLKEAVQALVELGPAGRKALMQSDPDRPMSMLAARLVQEAFDRMQA